MVESGLRLGELLIEAGVIQTAQLDKALAIQKKRQLRLGTILLQEGFVGETQLIQALSRRLSIPWVNLRHIDIDDALLDLVPASVAEEFFLIPIYIRTTGTGERALYVAMNDPTDESALRFVAASSGMMVKPMIAAPSEISAAIQVYYYGVEEASEEPEPPNKIPFPARPPGSSAIPPSVVPPQAAPPPHAPPTMRPGSVPPSTIRAGSVPPPTPAARAAASQPPSPRETPLPLELDEVDLDEIQEDGQTAKSEQPSEQNALQDSAEPADEKTTPPHSLIPSLEGGDEDAKRRARREVEKHMFGVGRKQLEGGMSLTLLDGTKIAFGGATNKRKQPVSGLSRDELIAGLRAVAAGAPFQDSLPSHQWQDFMAALLDILFRKHLVFFEEFIKELEKK